MCYSPEVKSELLAVPLSVIKKYTAESSQVTKALAVNLSRIIKADIYGAVTGLATPDPEAKQPVGTIFICVKHNRKIISIKKRFRGSPISIRNKAFVAMMEVIGKIL